METTLVSLKDEELVLLDGSCSADIQAKVDVAKRRLGDRQSMSNLSREVAEFISDAIELAQKKGKLAHRNCRIRRCRVCNKSAGYAKYTRNSKYHKKGETDFDSPLYFYGVDLLDSFIVFEGSPGLGCCDECWKSVKPVLTEKLDGIKAEIPEKITGHKPKYKRYNNMKCGNCGWEGHEGQMSLKPAIMGGYYRGGCPECKTEIHIFSSVIKTVDGFQVVESNE